jgi:hypothetical protein
MRSIAGCRPGGWDRALDLYASNAEGANGGLQRAIDAAFRIVDWMVCEVFFLSKSRLLSWSARTILDSREGPNYCRNSRHFKVQI